MKLVSISPVKGLFPPRRIWSGVTHGGDKKGRRTNARLQRLRLLPHQFHRSNCLIRLRYSQPILLPAQRIKRASKLLPGKTGKYIGGNPSPFQNNRNAVGKTQPGDGIEFPVIIDLQSGRNFSLRLRSFHSLQLQDARPRSLARLFHLLRKTYQRLNVIVEPRRNDKCANPFSEFQQPL